MIPTATWTSSPLIIEVGKSLYSWSWTDDYLDHPHVEGGLGRRMYFVQIKTRVLVCVHTAVAVL
eukprot:SAG31_NODE_1652_length_7628_cov_100.866118_4_plen_64_part_00